MRRTVIVLLTGLGLAACDAGPRQYSATGASVTYEVDSSEASRADVMAEEYCRNFGRSAHRNETTDYGSSQRVTYRCA